MRKILLNDCSEAVAAKLSILLGPTAEIVSDPFQAQRDISGFNLVILYAEGMDSAVRNRIRHLQVSTRFRNIPIVLLHPGNPCTAQPYPYTGATDTLALCDPPEALGARLRSHMAPSRAPSDAEMAYLTPFIASTREVLSTMASLDVDFKEVYFQAGHQLMGDISGVIGLSGGAKGTVIITFYWELAREVISSIMGVLPEAIGPELLNDGIGDIISMISGSAKRYLADTPFHFQQSLPTVILGRQQGIGTPEDKAVAVLLFDARDRAFTVQVSLTPGR